MDRDNDNKPGNCADTGGWWFNYCSSSALNNKDIIWFGFAGADNALQKSQMKINV